MGFADDRWDLSAPIRLLVQLLVAIGVVYWEGLVIRHLGMPFGEGVGLVGLGALAEPLTVLAIVAMINAVNMLDGLDGLLGGVLLIAFGCLWYLGITDGMEVVIATTLVLLSWALLGFLVWNYRGFNGRQARFFLGDFGSATLGYLLAYLAIQTAMDPHLELSTLVPPIAVAWVVALPAAELIAMVFKRLVRRDNPMVADQTHLHHLLMRGGFSAWQTVALIHGLMLSLALVGIVCWRLGVPEWVQYLMLTGFFVAYVFLSYFARDVAHFLRGQPSQARHPEADSEPVSNLER